MRLLFVTPNLAIGGIERQWSILLPALAARGHDVRLIAIDGRGPFFEEIIDHGVAAECLNVPRRRDSWRLLPLLVRADTADLVVSRGTSGLVVGDLVARRLRVKHVFAEHSGPDAKGAMKPLRQDQRMLVWLFGRRVARVIAVSESQILALQSRGFLASRVTVIPNGIDGSRFVVPEARSEMRRMLGLSDRAVAVLFVAKLRPEKRVDVFLDALELAQESNSEIRGIVVGDGPALDAVAERSRSNGGLVVTGARNDIPNLLAASDIVCITSDIEAMPMVALEGMAAGRPVVATDVGGVASVVRDGVTGFVVPPRSPAAVADAMLRLAGDPRLREDLGRRGRRVVGERFSVEAMVDAHEREFAAAAATARVAQVSRFLRPPVRRAR